MIFFDLTAVGFIACPRGKALAAATRAAGGAFSSCMMLEEYLSLQLTLGAQAPAHRLIPPGLPLTAFPELFNPLLSLSASVNFLSQSPARNAVLATLSYPVEPLLPKPVVLITQK